MSVRDALEAAWEETGSDVDESDNFSSQTATESVESGVEPTEATQSKESQVTDVLDAPEVWAAEDREKFNALAPEWKKFVLERERAVNSDYTQKTQKLGELRKRYEPLDKAIEPYQEFLQQSGVSLHDVAPRILAWEKAFRENPRQAILEAAQYHGVDPRELLAGVQAEQSQFDPALQPILSELEESRRFRERLIHKENQLAHEQRVQQIESDLKGMSAEKDANGNLIRPNFTELLPAIQGLIPQIATESDFHGKTHTEIAEEAYKRAFEPLKQLLKTQAVNQVQKAQKAMRAGSGISQSTVTSNGIAKPKNTKAALNYAWDKLSN